MAEDDDLERLGDLVGSLQRGLQANLEAHIGDTSEGSILGVWSSSQVTMIIEQAGGDRRQTACLRMPWQTAAEGVTLHEALYQLGPSWATATKRLQDVAQQMLFKFCGPLDDAKPPEWLSVARMTRAGANLVQADVRRGRVATCMAAYHGNWKALAILARQAPATILMEDNEGLTALDYLHDKAKSSPHTADPVLMHSLVFACFNCMASMQQLTVRTLQRSPFAEECWKWIAHAADGDRMGSAMQLLLQNPTNDVEEHLSDLVDAMEFREGAAAARLNQKVQRVKVLKKFCDLHEAAEDPFDAEQLRYEKALLEEKIRKAEEKARGQEQEHRRLKGQLAQMEDELTTARQSHASPSNMQDRRTDPLDREGVDAGTGVAHSEQGRPVPTLGGEMLLVGSSTSPRRAGASSARQVIRDIRGRWTIDVTESVSDECRASFAQLKETLGATAMLVAHDLYESKIHFMYELLQNADDNRYHPGVTPQVRFALRRHDADAASYCYFVNNEIGMTESDVRSLCDISRSTKTKTSGVTTGYKGVGWKSVFSVSNTPIVLSGDYRFSFSGGDRQGLGMVIPEYLEDEEFERLPQEVREAYAAGNTVFYLPLHLPDAGGSIEAEIDKMCANFAQLLFLRKIRQLHFSKGPDKEVELRLTAGSIGIEGQAVVSCQATPGAVTLEEGESLPERVTFEVAREGEVTVAFPLGLEKLPPQYIYSFLPVRFEGFKFAVNAEFHLTSDRHNFHKSTENTNRRNLIAPAFVKACRMNPQISARAVEYLGKEPVDSFWYHVRDRILGELRGFQCVNTEEGEMVCPHEVVTKGTDPAVKWVPKELLKEATELYFASESNCAETLQVLGVRAFGYPELYKCLVYKQGEWLTYNWRLTVTETHQNRNNFFSSVYGSLGDALVDGSGKVNPERLAQIQDLEIFPVAQESLGVKEEMNGMLLNQVTLASATGKVGIREGTGFYSGPCGAMPNAWQGPLVRYFHGDLDLSPYGAKLFSVLDIGPVTESKLEEEALRRLLRDNFGENDETPQGKVQQMASIWAALAVLHRCFQKNRPVPFEGISWEDLRESIALPSADGNLSNPSHLQPWSFLGADIRLPPGLKSVICSYVGLADEPISPLARMTVAVPTLIDIDKPEDNLSWEVFFHHLGCATMDPQQLFGRGNLEATARLGSILTDGRFWRSVGNCPRTMRYIEIAMGRQSSTNHLWLSHLPVQSEQGRVAGVKDFFLHECFHSLAGAHLPYVVGAPLTNDRAMRLLERLGVSLEVNRDSLLKCLRWLRETEVHDVGLLADVYIQLHRHGLIGFGEEALIYAPGRGKYLSVQECSWQPFAMPLLRQCGQVEALSSHYSRFTPEVSDALVSWVSPMPESSIWQLCAALKRVVQIAKGEPDVLATTAASSMEAAAGLYNAALYVVTRVADLLAEELRADGFEGEISAEQEVETEGAQIVRTFFQADRMIVVPMQPRPRLLFGSESYLTVAPGLRGEPCAQLALEVHYGVSLAIRNFFVGILKANPELKLEDVNRMPLLRQPASQLQGAASEVDEGLRGARVLALAPEEGVVPPRPQPMPEVSDASHALQLAQRVPCANFAEPQAGSVPYGGCSYAFDIPRGPGCSVPASRSGGTCPPQEGAAAHCGWHGHEHNGNCRWRFLASTDGFAWFYREGCYEQAARQLSANLDTRILTHVVCVGFGLQPSQVGIAYDASGACVCSDFLLLDAQQVERASQQPTREQNAIILASELAHAVAHQSYGPGHGGQLNRLQSEILAQVLPQILTTLATADTSQSCSARSRLSSAS